MTFEPTRSAALARLSAFAPKMGRAYASNRNADVPGHPHVSGLSPYLRHRILTEDEVLEEVLRHHAPSTAEKFIQEVYWRTYWKGWLEQRPSVWTSYRAGLQQALNRVQSESGLRRDWEAACKGETEFDCMNHWAQELVSTGYLHNHARMWFASIWVFTLRLPWELGADFFMRHLLDGDPASNTLGWRWVAGLQTIGKTYLARPDNIAKYTEGRFRPTGLATFAAPLDGPPHPERGPVPQSGSIPSGKIGLLITEDDLSPDWVLEDVETASIAAYNGTAHRSPLEVAPHVGAFVEGALSDLEGRIGPFERPETPADIDDWTKSQGLEAIVMSYSPVGGTSDAVREVKTPIIQRVRPYDARAWPHAKAGFFKFKSQIPKLLKVYDKQGQLI
ncbi:MAG: FAD-binding domain-containing protein [Pseudomonadota bacterium]